MTLNIRPAWSHEIATGYDILRACGVDMHQRLGLDHWYPFMDYDIFVQSIQGSTVYAVLDNAEQIAVFTLTRQPRNYYRPDIWHDPWADALYFGSFAVRPDRQRGGVGAWCMAQVDRMTRAAGCAALRFDAIASHPALLAFYERLGYQRRQTINLSDRSLVCFEKTFSA